MQDEKVFEVRDTREKFFIVDDAYFNGWAWKCGDAGNLVYMITKIEKSGVKVTWEGEGTRPYSQR